MLRPALLIAVTLCLVPPTTTSIAEPAPGDDVVLDVAGPDRPVNEGARAVVTVTLSQARSEPVTVEHATADRTATAPSDSQELHGKRPARRR
jgi:hypothetical protein